MTKSSRIPDPGGNARDPADTNEQVSAGADRLCSLPENAERLPESDMADRCRKCGKPTEWAGRGRRRDYCPACNRRRGSVRPRSEPPGARIVLDPESERLYSGVGGADRGQSPWRLLTNAVADTVRVNAEGLVTGVGIQQTLRATQDGITTYNFLHYRSSGVWVKPRAGCETVLVDRHLAPRRAVTPLTFLEPLDENETREIGYDVVYRRPDRNPDLKFAHARQIATDTVGRVEMCLLFKTYGTVVEICKWQSLAEEPVEQRVRPLPSREFTYVWNEPEPGYFYGIRWRLNDLPGTRSN